MFSQLKKRSIIRYSNAEKVRTRRRKKNKAKKKKIAEFKKNVIKEIEEASEVKETKSNLILVDRPLCNYFKTYEIDAQ